MKCYVSQGSHLGHNIVSLQIHPIGIASLGKLQEKLDL